VIRVAGGQGFYGDTPRAVEGLLDDGIDYLCLEALAELTLAILQKDRQKDETRGYTRDLPLYLGAALPAVAAGRTKVITNAGGINPAAAARAAVDTAKSMGISGIRIATVLGDDLMPRLDEIAAATRLVHLDSGAAFSEFPGTPLFAAAYLGARPIADALAQGADVVITGRVTDASLFLGPLMHEHGWAWDDWDRLAAGTLVGHVLECSGQSAGGNLSRDWWTVPRPWDLPYPIGEVDADGTAVITKPATSGGRVDVDTVRHQLLYEVHDPAAYVTPDVVADFSRVTMEADGVDRVRVSGADGRPRPEMLKVSVGQHDGWIGEGQISYAGPGAVPRARLAREVVAGRLALSGPASTEVRYDLIGIDALHGGVSRPVGESYEVRLRVAARVSTESDAWRVAREIESLYTNGPAGGGGASTTVKPVLAMRSTLLPRSLVSWRVDYETV
jgi:acyclic terpene utilization AtuA family protein